MRPHDSWKPSTASRSGCNVTIQPVPHRGSNTTSVKGTRAFSLKGTIAAQVLDTLLTRVSSFQVRENGLVRCREYSARLSPQVGIPRNRVQNTWQS